MLIMKYALFDVVQRHLPNPTVRASVSNGPRRRCIRPNGL